MAANLPRPSTEENVSSTLSAGITDVATTITIADASKLVAPCYLVIDRVDSSGTLKSTSLWEYIKVTNIAGNDLTVTRAQNGSTAQSHSSGSVIEAVVTSAHFEDWYNVLNPEHDVSGGHVITGTMTVAGMNLASVATIAVASIGTLNANTFTPTSLTMSTLVVTSIASIARGEFKAINASSVASIALPRSSVSNQHISLPVLGYVSTTSDVNTNSSSYTDITGAVVTISPTVASNLIVMAQVTSYNDTANGSQNLFVVTLDGVIQGADPAMTAIQQDNATGNYNITTSYTGLISGATAAPHGIKIRGKVTAGTMHTTHASLIVIPYAQ
jgi:hypothetical protein